MYFGQENKGWLEFGVSMDVGGCGVSGLMSVDAEAGFVLPLRMSVAHVAHSNTRSPQTKVCGSNNGNADLSIGIATHFGILVQVQYSSQWVLQKIVRTWCKQE
jgi:hypothetical protein